MGGGSTKVYAPKPSAAETELMQEQLTILRESRADQALLKPYLLQSMGFVEEEGGTIRKMTEEETVAGMSTLEKGSYENLKLLQERQTAALKGELPVSPALEEDIAGREAQLKEEMSRRLGPDWMTTTPGQQGWSEFQKKAGLLREETRRGEISGLGGLALSQAGYWEAEKRGEAGDIQGYGQRLFPLMQAYGQAAQPYQFYSGLEAQARWQTMQAKMARMAGKQQAFSSGGFGALSSRDVKKDIEKFSDKEALEMVSNTKPVRYRYKDESSRSPKHTGLIAEEAPDSITTPDKKMINFGDQLGLLNAAIRAMNKKVSRLEQRRV